MLPVGNLLIPKPDSDDRFIVVFRVRNGHNLLAANTTGEISRFLKHSLPRLNIRGKLSKLHLWHISNSQFAGLIQQPKRQLVNIHATRIDLNAIATSLLLLGGTPFCTAGFRLRCSLCNAN